MTKVIEIADLHKNFGGVCAVGGLSLEIEEGEIYGLVGPDGAGKTTTMRMIAGLIRADKGSIQVLGQSISQHARSARLMMGYMPQQYSLYSDLSVQENLRFFAGMFGILGAKMRERETRLLKIARLEDYRDRAAGALSGGMYKKLALACALIHYPRLLLLDEPTNGVDPISRRDLWSFLHELVKDGMAVLLSTPYMDEAERCDRVGLLLEGRLAAEGSPAEMRDGFEETVFEIQAEPQNQARECLAGAQGVSRVYTVGKKIHVSSPLGSNFAENLGRLLENAGIAVARIGPVPPSFEDIFMHMATLPGPSSGESSPDAHE
jgi:ABC-2 type transport system ATP-binding protein